MDKNTKTREELVEDNATALLNTLLEDDGDPAAEAPTKEKVVKLVPQGK
jgi:hypothetical protein